MNNENNIDVRNEEIQEILGTPPGWILRFGTLIFLIVIVLLIWLSYWIQYPDVVESEIIVSFNDPPSNDNTVGVNEITFNKTFPLYELSAVNLNT